MFTIRHPRDWLRSSGPFPTFGIGEYASMFAYNNALYPIFGSTSYGSSPQDPIDSTFASMGASAYKGNAVVFACIAVRMLHFSEARFQFRQLRDGRPGDLFGKPTLSLLERPEPGFTTGDMLARAILDVDLAGNWIAVKRGDRIKRLRPDWVDLVIGTDSGGERYDVDAEVIGYIYHPGGRGTSDAPVFLLADQVAHFKPLPDPAEPYKGMSWVTPMIQEVMADSAARDHKLKFFENGATTNLIVNLDPARYTHEQYKEVAERWKVEHEGIANAYRTVILRGAADVRPIGLNFEQMDFKIVQGAGETRIAAAAGVPPVVVGLSEGLQAATYSNYDQARRRFADGTLRPLWRNIAGSLETLVPPPDNQSQLWYDDRDIAFLRIDQTEEAEVLQRKAAAINTLVTAGFDPDTARDAVNSGDLSRLEHIGLPSVQLQSSPQPALPSGNGNTPAATAATPEV
jgi:HK97 family phage portal protein